MLVPQVTQKRSAGVTRRCSVRVNGSRNRTEGFCSSARMARANVGAMGCRNLNHGRYGNQTWPKLAFYIVNRPSSPFTTCLSPPRKCPTRAPLHARLDRSMGWLMTGAATYAPFATPGMLNLPAWLLDSSAFHAA